MISDQKEAIEIYTQLQQQISWPILDALKVAREPHKPIVRTCKWDEGYPIGLGLHYTNGPNGTKTIHWANDPGWGNKQCSFQVIIYDRITKDKVGEMWIKIDPAIRKLFPVPTVILADWRWSTWATNWMNGKVMGVENRNVGYKYSSHQLEKNLDKTGVSIGGRIWEPYTREQMVCNVNYGRLANAWTGYKFDPDYILSHYQVSTARADTGLAYPLRKVRYSIFSDSPVTELTWLNDHPMAPDTDIEYDEMWESIPDTRHDEPGDDVFNPTIITSAASKDPQALTATFYQMGYNCGPEMPLPETLQMFTRWFQRSTHYYKDASRHLNVDGDAGPLTQAALDKRLKELKLV
jgi:hypothetical protein